MEALLEELECGFHPVEGVTTVHCEVVAAVREAYRDLHLFPTTPPAGVRFYSAAAARAHELTRESAAQSILDQALRGFDYSRLIERAWRDGARIFVELGPGGSCTRMVGRILGERPHMAAAVCRPGESEVLSLVTLLARLIAERVPVDLEPLHPSLAAAEIAAGEEVAAPQVEIPAGGEPFKVPLPARVLGDGMAAAMMLLPEVDLTEPAASGDLETVIAQAGADVVAVIYSREREPVRVRGGGIELGTLTWSSAAGGVAGGVAGSV
ncbi:MAG: hypothetical protein ACE5GW_13140, partial [Planctomycetota bacterium]